MTDTLIRAEIPPDTEGIRAVNIAAFADHPYSQQTEHLIVEALRDAGAIAASQVATRDDQVVGYVAFSEATVGEMPGRWLMVGPVAVLPEYQHQGIGSLLMLWGIAEAINLDAEGCVLVGDPGFYQRFGFKTYPGLVHHGVPDEFVLGLAFRDEEPTGEITAHEAFEVQAEAEAE